MQNFLTKLSVLLLIYFTFTGISLALSPEAHLPDVLEERARNIFLQVRCPICDGQVIESSDTEVASGLRSLVRQQISAGKSDKEIISYLTKTYGDDIINVPTFSSNTLFLWLAPLFFLICGIWGIFLFTRQSNLKLQTKKINE